MEVVAQGSNELFAAQPAGQTITPRSPWGDFLTRTQGWCYEDCDKTDEPHQIYRADTHLLETPSDENTGVTLILHPTGASNDIRLYAPDDHHTEHPKSHPALKGSLAGEALRGSRVVRCGYWLHHMDNHNTYRGPAVPQDAAEFFKKVVFNAAGVIPEWAIAFKRPGKPYLKPFAAEERQKAWQTGLIKVEKPKVVNQFLQSYIFERAATTAQLNLSSRFLHERDPVQRWLLAKQILDTAAVKATDTMATEFEKMYRKQLMPPNNSWRAAKFVVSRLANHESEKSRLSRELQDMFWARIQAA